MAQNNGRPNISKKLHLKNDSFLEALRGIGDSTLSTAKNDLLKKGAKDIFDSLSPFTPYSTQDEQKGSKDPLENETLWENRYRKLQRQHETVRREEKVVFTRQERETQTQVKSLQDEIKKLALATGELAKEVQVAAIQEEVNPGTYHLNFLQRLLSVIKALKAQVQESSLWLSSWNNRSKKKNIYWNKFKKSGSSFSLHHDRAVATQAG